MDDASPTARARALERAQALALCLPAALLLWPGPGAPLADDVLPALTGTGWALPAALPAGLLVLVRGAWRAPLALYLYAAFLTVGALAAYVTPPSDTLAASQALQLGLATLLTLAGGASLSAEGRRWLAIGLTGLAALALLPTLPLARDDVHGALGNAAATSESALGGLLVAAAVLPRARGTLLALLGALLALGVAHAARAPVLSTLGLVLAGLLAVRVARAREPGARRWLVAFGLAAALAGGLRAARPRTPPPPEATAATTASDVSGLEVRELVARASLAMLSEHALLGVGRGQFAAAFPPWRDAREVELSSHGHRLPGQTTEVEHPHDDWLLGVLETGLAGGAAWLAFLVWSVLAGWRALRGGEPARAALALAALGWLGAALLRGPLLVEPASATLAFAALGALHAGDGERRAAWRLVLNVALVAAFFQLPRALALVRHGRALAAGAREEVNPFDAAGRALEAVGDSVVARALYARYAPIAAAARGADDFDAVPAWRSVLAVRPHHFEAHMELGNAWARARRFDEARTEYLAALALDPGEPALRRNLARLEVQAGRIDEALVWADALRAEGRLPEGWFEGAVAECARDLRPEAARALLARARPTWKDLSTRSLWDLSQIESDAGLARALEGLAHLEWAREQVAAGDPATAVRSYRQALRGLTDPAHGTPSPLVRLELAAALLRAGRGSEAAEEAAQAAPPMRDLVRLEPWAGEELMRAGLIGR